MTFAAGLASALVVASTLLVAIALVATSAYAMIASPRLRRRRSRARARRQYLARHAQRVDRLEAANAPTRELDDLHWIARTTRESSADPGRDPYELEPWLDRYADVAIARARCSSLLAQLERAALVWRVEIAGPRTTSVLARRIQHAALVAQRQQELDESRGELSQLVRWCAERACLDARETLSPETKE